MKKENIELIALHIRNTPMTINGPLLSSYWLIKDETAPYKMNKLQWIKISTKKNPNTYATIIIIPFEIDSAIGYVNSTAKEQLIGIIGITENPSIAEFNAKITVSYV